MHFSGDQLVTLVQALTTLVGSAIALVAALKAGKRADQAQKSADQAHVEAGEAARQQINFALANAAGGRWMYADGAAASAGPQILPPQKEGGTA